MNRKAIAGFAVIVAAMVGGRVWADHCHSGHGSEGAVMHEAKEMKSDGPAKGGQKTCPVGMEQVKADSYVDYEGKRVYLCCDGCRATFSNDPEKYLAKLAELGEVPEAIPGSKAQTMCPVMGGKIEKNVYVDHEGQRVYFCCPGCKDTFLKKPAKYLKKIEKAGEVPEKI